MSADLDLISELTSVAGINTTARNTEILRHVTDLFVLRAPLLSEDEISLYDDVIIRLMVEVEMAAKALLSMRLAPISNSPRQTIKSLAFDDHIEVAGPVLIQSERLTEADLIENAKFGGQGHMLAISSRRMLGEKLTDILIERGDKHVLMSTAQNAGAKISESGFSLLTKRANHDDALTTCVGDRQDIPPHIFRQLIERASEKVRVKLEASRPDLAELIRHTLTEVGRQIETEQLESFIAETRHRGAAEFVDEASSLKIQKIAQSGTLKDMALTLARICQMPVVFVESAIQQRRSETLLLLTKANSISSVAVKAVLEMRARDGLIPYHEIAECLSGFERVERQTAQHILNFYRTQDDKSFSGHPPLGKRH
jgi:uncharacterized protein (DUF2336 family)